MGSTKIQQIACLFLPLPDKADGKQATAFPYINPPL